jgi:hypothetical protein
VTISKYSDIHKKSPKEAAEIVGDVDRRNYLAHSIRDIEFAILKTQGRHYHIITYTSETSRKSKIIFYDQCCEIRLTCEYNEIDERKIRLILAHELGHLVYNVDRLKNPEILENIKTTDKEEIYAWQFAYHLIDKKSFEHADNTQKKKFIYRPGELKASLTSILKDKKREICEAVIRSLDG